MNDRLRVWLHYYIAQLLSVLRLYERAIDEFKAALESDRNFAAAWRCMGFLHAQRGREAAAAQAFQEALRLRPDDDVTRFNLGFIHHQQKRYAEAIAEFERVLKTAPTNDRAWYGMGLCREQLGEMDKAVEALKEAARLQYFNPHAGYHLALAYHKLGEHEKAQAEYERVKSFDPKFAEQIRRETGIA